MGCRDRFAPEKQVAAFETQNDWIDIQIKHAMLKKNELLQRWISQSTEVEKKRYRRFLNIVTQLIRFAKQFAHQKILGEFQHREVFAGPSKLLRKSWITYSTGSRKNERILRNDKPLLSSKIATHIMT